jgi:hypothetical protein
MMLQMVAIRKMNPDTGLLPSTTTQGQALNKKNLSESDLCDKFIRPAMEQAGWNGLDQIYREYPLRAGRVVVRGSKAQRDKPTVLRADYALFFKANIPLVEAKDNQHAVGAGTGTAQPKMNQSKLNGILIGLAPLAEQSRIVARVESLRRLCADLRQRLSASQTTQAHLAEALVESVAG